MAAIEADVSTTNKELKELSPKVISAWAKFSKAVTKFADVYQPMGFSYETKKH
ncbi:MAG TPA: hypothetical protein VMW66_00130 [Elusimicrobiales bacterium]|nr:hypothetical protein [Elusimicrobiales bacterium]